VRRGWASRGLARQGRRGNDRKEPAGAHGQAKPAGFLSNAWFLNRLVVAESLAVERAPIAIVDRGDRLLADHWHAGEIA